MFFRMLKKDIMEKKGLNIILTLFMCLASTLTVCSAIILYVNTIGYNKELRDLNAAEVTVLTVQDLDDREGRVQKTLEWLQAEENVVRVEHTDGLMFHSNAVDFIGVDEESSSSLIHREYYAFNPNSEHNQVKDMDSAPIEVPYGCVAVPQYLHNIGGARIGDKVRIITQMGNVYEFTVCAFVKDPSMNGWYRLFFNEEDYEVLKADSPIVEDVYMIDMTDDCGNAEETRIITGFSDKEEELGETVDSYKKHGYNPDHESSIVLDVIMMICSGFLIVMVFMTVSFTIKTAIKNEEKELGMLKALGVESASFNWLFAAKYLAISLVGCVVGFFGGIQLATMDIKYVCYGEFKPSFGVLIPIAAISSLLTFVVIVFFVSISLRRMKKISIMDVIAGENRGERFKKLPGILLHKIKHINIPFYLALTDLTNRIKRYSFLIIAYTMAITLLLTFLEVRETTNTKYWIVNCWGYPDFDFALDIPDDVEEIYIERGGSVKGAFDIINEELAEVGIPAKVDYFFWTNVNVSCNGKSYSSFLQYRIPDGMYSVLYEGVRPKLRNEVMVDAYHAKIDDIHIGDTVSVEYFKFNEDGLTSSLVTEDFIVTALVDKPMADLTVFMSNEFNDAARYNVVEIPGRIDAPESEHDKYIEMMRDMFGKTSIRDAQQEVDYSLGDMKDEFDILLYVLVPIMFVMMILVTVLYQSVNIIDETPDIALLKCSGFSNGSVKIWQILRSIMIVAMSSILAVILQNTIVLALIRRIFGVLSAMVDYTPYRHVLMFYVGVPATVILLVAITIYITLRTVKKIEICRIRED